MEKSLIKKYAKLIVRNGVNVQEDQIVCINAPVEANELVRELVVECYNAKARFVHVKYSDQLCNKAAYLSASIEELQKVHEHDVMFSRYIVDNGGCNISITSPIPDVLVGVDQVKLQKSSLARAQAFSFLDDYFSDNHGQWVVAAYPNKSWASKVFSDVDEETAYQLLSQAILKAVHVDSTNDPILGWNEHNKLMMSRNQWLNSYRFDKLIFTNSLGTNLEVGLVEGHIWAGGGEYTNRTKVFFNPNLPTEETFTMPHNHKTNGIVFSTKPLDFRGVLIEDFSLEFKDGKVVNYKARKNEEALTNLINFDEGSCRLGEVALVPYNSPISLMNILFYNTLFDENASCHLALGSAYAVTNLQDAINLSPDQLKEKGCNISKTHVDFMFGTADMKVTGVTKDGKEITIMEKGNFVI